MARDRGRRQSEGYQLPVRVSVTKETHEAMLESAKVNGKEDNYWRWFRNCAELIQDERF